MIDNYVRISDLAKKASVLSSTIRHYTDFGLLRVAMETDGGHRLYDVESSMRRLAFIQALAKRGRSLDEIKEELNRRQNQLVVLLVDDEPEVIDFVRSAFELYGGKSSGSSDDSPLPQAKGNGGQKKMPAVDLSVVSDGFSAGKRTNEILPDLVILDLMLPGINGFKICRAIREDIELAGVKILAITGYDTEENRRAIMASGANGYLAKPFGVQELMQKLEEMRLW